jgi:hypothetical protein
VIPPGSGGYEAGRDIHITQGTPPTSQPLAGQPSTSFDRARQLVRASGSAALGGGEERSEALLARAKEIDAQNPAITIAIARQTEDPDEVMDMLAGVEPVDDTQAALLELTRAGAESARQNIQAAKGHVAAARELHPDSPMVEEVGANIVLFAALGGLPDDVAPDRSELAGVGEKLRRRAGLEFADLLSGRSDRSPDRASPGRGPPRPGPGLSMTGQC